MKAGIAGAGIMGRLLAFHLVNSGWKVTLFDQDDRHCLNNCSMAAAGLLAAATELEKSDSLSISLCRDALNFHWDSIIKSLPEPIYFEKKGIIALAHVQDKNELIRFTHLITAKQDGKTSYQKLNGQELQKIEPELNKFEEGYFFPEEGQLDNQALIQSLGLYLESKKINWCEKTFVQAVKPNKIVTSNTDHYFDIALDCRGLGAKDNFKDLRGLRGELVWLHAPQVQIQRPIRLLNPRHNLYIAPRPNQIYILGASEIESELRTPITVRTVLELLSAAYSIHPGFAEAALIRTVQHVRPTLSDSKPHILYADGFIGVNGLYRHGFSLAPSLAIEIIKWINGGASQVNYPQLWSHCDEYLS